MFVDPAYAREHSPDGSVLVHPVFITTIAFWLAKQGSPMSWIRTPGARNPFQRIEVKERIRVGERITMLQENSDRFIRRGKPYITTHAILRDQHGTEKAAIWATLILPPTREDVRRFATA